jgi:methylthioribose-1-phosphate isomerase
MDLKFKKMIVKGALSLAVAAVIGYMIKVEDAAQDRLDEHYHNSSKKN